jgi:hypothetical protein
MKPSRRYFTPNVSRVSNCHGDTNGDRPYKSRRQFGLDPERRSDFHQLKDPVLPRRPPRPFLYWCDLRATAFGSLVRYGAKGVVRGLGGTNDRLHC